MIFNPRPPGLSGAGCSNPRPLSSTLRCNSPLTVSRLIVTSEARLWRMTLVSASCTIRYTWVADVSLRRKGASKLALNSTRTPPLTPPGPRRERLEGRRKATSLTAHGRQAARERTGALDGVVDESDD